MLRVFKQNTLAQIFVILAATAALWSRAFLFDIRPVASQYFSPLYDLLYNFVAPRPQLSYVIALILTLAEGIWLNILLINHKITQPNSLLPTLIYTLAMGWDAAQLTTTPLLLVNIMVIASFGQLLSSGNLTLDFEHNFNAAFFIGLAALCYTPALSLLIPYILIFVIYKLYSWRDIIVCILGVIAPFIILFTYAFLCDKLFYYTVLLRHDFMDVNISIARPSLHTILSCAAYLLLLLAALTNVYASAGEKVIHQRLNTFILTLPLIASSILLLFVSVFPFETQSSAPSLTFAATLFLCTKRKRAWISEILFWLIIIAALL